MRLPNSNPMRNDWMKAINAANGLSNDCIPNGLICMNHFEANDITKRGKEYRLITGAKPTLFYVDCIDHDKNEDCLDSSKFHHCAEMEKELEDTKKTYQDEISRCNLLNLKLHTSLEHLKEDARERYAESKNVSDSLKKENDRLEDELRVLRPMVIFFMHNTLARI